MNGNTRLLKLFNHLENLFSFLRVFSATISRGLRGHIDISKDTKKRIQDAATEMGYRQNTFASNLRKQKTDTIGVVLPELTSHFMSSVLAGIEKVTTKTGYDIIITHSSESYEKEVANVINLFHKRVDGVIASLASDTKNLNHFQRFIDKNVPIVFFDRVEEKDENLKVIIDNYKGGYAATQHLIDQGCKKIVLVTANLQRNVYAQRHNGYVDALAANNIEFDKNLVFINDLSEQSCIHAAKKVAKMDPCPDGAFITNDFSAVVFMNKIKELGFKIPEDIAIVGFNDDTISRMVKPQLTTIHYPGMEIGEIAASSLINHLNGSSDMKLTQTIMVKSELIIRDSSLKKIKND
ncbi:MAG: LacI family DNA-binding transcriptional regulator [Sediminibacterium sp.]